MITPPIIVIETGDVELYEAISDAELDLEPIDVENNEFTIFDSQGLVLLPVVCDDHIHVRLMESSPRDLRPSELANILRRFLDRLGEDRTLVASEGLKHLTLQDLLATLDAFQKRGRRRRGFWFWRSRS